MKLAGFNMRMLALIASMAIMTACSGPAGVPSSGASSASGATHRVVDVLSGDSLTIVYRGAYTPVKLAGIIAGGKEGAAALEELIGASEVRLEPVFDHVEERTDDGLLLAHVFAGSKHLNVEQIKNGSAKADAKYEGRYKEQLAN